MFRLNYFGYEMPIWVSILMIVLFVITFLVMIYYYTTILIWHLLYPLDHIVLENL